MQGRITSFKCPIHPVFRHALKSVFAEYFYESECLIRLHLQHVSIESSLCQTHKSALL